MWCSFLWPCLGFCFVFSIIWPFRKPCLLEGFSRFLNQLFLLSLPPGSSSSILIINIKACIWGRMDTCVCMTEFLYWPPATITMLFISYQFSSVQFSCSVVSNSLRPHEAQHAWPPCPTQTPGVYSNSCTSSRWCHPAISSSVIPFSSWPQSLPASGSFPTNQLFAWGSQSTGVSTSASVLPMNTQDWSPLGWTGWISLQSKGLSRVFSNTIVEKHQFFSAQLSSQSNSHKP